MGGSGPRVRMGAANDGALGGGGGQQSAVTAPATHQKHAAVIPRILPRRRRAPHYCPL